jgi:hypothetical protein
MKLAAVQSIGRLIACVVVAAAVGCGGKQLDLGGDTPNPNSYSGPIDSTAGGAGADAATAAAAPQPVTIAADQHRVRALAAAGHRIYWLSTVDAITTIQGTLRGCDPSDCRNTLTTYVDGYWFSSDADVKEIAADGTNVYWHARDGVRACPISGCNGEGALLVAHASGIVSDGAHLYWIDDGGSATSLPDVHGNVTVRRCPVSGGLPETLAAFRATSPCSPGFVLGAATVYAVANSEIDLSCRIVAIAAAANAAPTTIVEQLQPPRLSAVTSTAIYWINPVAGGAAVSCPVSGCTGGPSVFAYLGGAPAENDGSQMQLLADDRGVYFGNWHELRACSADGCAGQPRVLAQWSPATGCVAADASYVYWADARYQEPPADPEDSIRRVRKWAP